MIGPAPSERQGPNPRPNGFEATVSTKRSRPFPRPLLGHPHPCPALPSHHGSGRRAGERESSARHHPGGSVPTPRNMGLEATVSTRRSRPLPRPIPGHPPPHARRCRPCWGEASTGEVAFAQRHHGGRPNPLCHGASIPPFSPEHPVFLARPLLDVPLLCSRLGTPSGRLFRGPRARHHCVLPPIPGSPAASPRPPAGFQARINDHASSQRGEAPALEALDRPEVHRVGGSSGAPGPGTPCVLPPTPGNLPYRHALRLGLRPASTTTPAPEGARRRDQGPRSLWGFKRVAAARDSTGSPPRRNGLGAESVGWAAPKSGLRLPVPTAVLARPRPLRPGYGGASKVRVPDPSSTSGPR